MPYHTRPNRITRRTTRSTPSTQRSTPSTQRSTPSTQQSIPSAQRIAIQSTPSTSNVLGSPMGATNAQGKPAPAGYHYMPDGSLMSDIEHARLVSATAELKTISNFHLDLHNIPEAGETRKFKILGEQGAIFSLEIKRGTDFYNFQTNLFQATKTRLSNIKLSQGVYSGKIVFPKVTVGAEFDVYLWAEDVYGSKHSPYVEVRFPDGSMDINSSTGSNSNLMQKVLYQTLDTSVILSNYSPNGTMTVVNANQTIKTSRGKKYGAYIPFSISATIASTYGISIDRQPTTSDILAFVTRTIGDPINIPGEDVYPTATTAFTGDDVNGAVTSGAVVRMDNTDLSAVIAVGDKITTTVMTDTVNGARDTSAVAVTMDSAVATKMAVGDRVTGNAALDAGVFTVASLDSTNVFSISAVVAIADGITLSFSSKINRDLTTVTVVETGSVATDFTMSQAIQFRDNAPLTFFNRRNHRWSVDNIDGLKGGMRTVPGVYFASTPTIRDFTQKITTLENEIGEKVNIINTVAPLETLGVKPVFTRNSTTKVKTVVQSGNIVFSDQALLSFSGVDAKIYGYGLDEVNRLSGYDIDFTDLRVELNTITTTTTAAVSASTTIPVTSKNGIAAPTTQTVDGATTGSKTVVLDSVTGLNVGQSLYVGTGLVGTPTITDVDTANKRITLSTVQTFGDGITLTFPNSIISGIGINPAVVNPYVASIASLNLTASVAQTLEDAQTFTFTGTGTIATITGNIRINEVGNEDVTLRFDVEKFLTLHTN